MRELNMFFKDKNIEYENLLAYGFVQNGDCYTYEKYIADNQFKVIVDISAARQCSRVIDLACDEEYALADVAGSTGDFVGSIKAEYEAVIFDILEKCTTPNVFKSSFAKEIIKYVKEKYKDEPEYLWQKFPDNAVLRNKKNNKWYAALIVLSQRKIGLDSDELVDIIDLRYPKDKIAEIIDNKTIFPGYHMNKNNWITIQLNGSVALDKIISLLNSSYELSLKK